MNRAGGIPVEFAGGEEVPVSDGRGFKTYHNSEICESRWTRKGKILKTERCPSG
jgi:hypothetical protein